MKTILSIAGLLALHPGHALADVGAGSSSWFAAGFAHPLTGVDHIAVMVAVGLWAGLRGDRALWIWPATFIGVMLIGGVLGLAHLPWPYAEPAILASVVTLGILVTLAVELPVWAGALVIGAFAVFHGHAHGSEVPEAISGTAYLAGFAMATALLHGVGIGFALLANRVHARPVVRLAGIACVVVGCWLVARV